MKNQTDKINQNSHSDVYASADTTPLKSEMLDSTEGEALNSTQNQLHQKQDNHSTSSHSPMEQFKIQKLKEVKFLGFDISYTNSSLWLTIGFILSSLIFLLFSKTRSLIPNRRQAFVEVIYNFTSDMLDKNSEGYGNKFFPLIFSLFLFVLSCNVLGVLPYSFTVTSHIIVTFILAMIVFLLCVGISIVKHKWKFFSIFVPSGTPAFLVPLLFIIEFFAYLARPISLSVRLFANMLAGHTMLKVIAGFVVPMGMIGGWIPVVLLSILTGFEFLVALLQGYIFALLSCIYIGEAMKDSH